MLLNVNRSFILNSRIDVMVLCPLLKLAVVQFFQHYNITTITREWLQYGWSTFLLCCGCCLLWLLLLVYLFLLVTHINSLSDDGCLMRTSNFGQCLKKMNIRREYNGGQWALENSSAAARQSRTRVIVRVTETDRRSTANLRASLISWISRLYTMCRSNNVSNTGRPKTEGWLNMSLAVSCILLSDCDLVPPFRYTVLNSYSGDTLCQWPKLKKRRKCSPWMLF